METTAAERGWGPGWPSCQADRMVTFKAAGRNFTCRREVGTIFAYLINRFDSEIENIGDIPDDGAFACRPIRGTRIPSNHSWGLAADLNWQKHPLGASGTFANWQVSRIHLMTRELRFVRWGGDYENRIDAMHFEWLGTPADAQTITRRIQALDPWPAYDGHVLLRGAKGNRVALVQKRLGVPKTYVFDSRTEAAVRAFQTDRTLTVNGQVNKPVWDRLHWKLR
jgi:hypothetical protein